MIIRGRVCYNDTSQVSSLSVPISPTLEIVTDGIFLPGVSTIMNNVVNSNIGVPINNIALMVIGFTPSMSACMSLSSMNFFFYIGISSMGILNALIVSQSTSQVSKIGAGSSSIPYQAIPCGGGHIPPLFPSIGSRAFPSSKPKSFIGWGTSIISTIMPSTSTSFMLYGRLRVLHVYSAKREKPLQISLESHARLFPFSRDVIKGKALSWLV
jgi:hypothetical protein